MCFDLSEWTNECFFFGLMVAVELLVVGVLTFARSEG